MGQEETMWAEPTAVAPTGCRAGWLSLRLALSSNRFSAAHESTWLRNR